VCWKLIRGCIVFWRQIHKAQYFSLGYADGEEVQIGCYFMCLKVSPSGRVAQNSLTENAGVQLIWAAELNWTRERESGRRCKIAIQ